MKQITEALKSKKSKNKAEDREQLENWARKGFLFALLDPFFEIPMQHERARLETRDTDPMFYEVIAWDQVTYEPPFMVKISLESLDWILNALSTERWGIFIAADCELEELARHYQRFVIAKGPDGNPYFLRFHDASVLDVLLRTWDNKEKAIFFGPSLAFGLPDLDSMTIKFQNSPLGGRRRVRPDPEDCLLHLRDSQLRACGEAIDRDLIKVIYWHLRNHHARSVQFLDREVLEERISLAISKGRRYLLGTVSDLAGFTALMFELAPNFDDHPSFRNVLLDPDIAPERKLRRLSETISDREWSEAAVLYDRLFWASAQKRK